MEKSKEAQNVEADIQRIQDELGKGLTIEAISEKLGMDMEYAKFLFYFFIIG